MKQKDQDERYDAIYRSVDERFDVANPDLHHLIQVCIDHDGRIPQDVRDRYANRVQSVALDYIEAVTALDLSTDPVEGSLDSDAKSLSKRTDWPSPKL